METHGRKTRTRFSADGNSEVGDDEVGGKYRADTEIMNLAKKTKQSEREG